MNIVHEVKSYGCHEVVSLVHDPSPNQIEYLDLLKIHDSGALNVEAIAEFQSRPLLYIVDGNKPENKKYRQEILDLQCLLANRGEKAFLGVLKPGELNVYPVNLDRQFLKEGKKKTIKSDSPEAPLFFQTVISGLLDIDGQPDISDYVFRTIHDLLAASSRVLIEQHGVYHLDALSLLGRALFFRFLCDRGIVLPAELETICSSAATPADCFNNLENSILVCQWLDATFNGDLLPFSDAYLTVFNDIVEQTEGKVFNHLQAILKGWKHAGNDAFQQKIDWEDLNFAHIPIGVLSQVYESFSEAWDPILRKSTSVFYTPKNIARYLVDDAFEGMVDKRNAKILDPSCGAGIFLVLAFRKLVAAEWGHSGKMPDTETIQSILYNQLCGFDISESALRLAALSLYITAIELNGSPHPPANLKFPKPLQDVVLFNHRKVEETQKSGFVLGSLRSDLDDRFNSRFNLVIGNPPWRKLTGDSKENKVHNSQFTKITRRVLRERGLDEIAKGYNNPDNNPDLPFLWKSMEWAKPDGIVAMVLPSRIFLKQSGPGTRAFNAIVQGIEITGILNGSNLSDTPVWLEMSQPFMLFFSRNRKPDENHHFHFVTPHFEPPINDKGRLRIDYQSAQPIALQRVVDNPHLLKTIAIGTTLDLEILEKLDALNWPTVKSFWQSEELYSGLGYNRSPRLKQKEAFFMNGLPDLKLPSKGDFGVDVALLKKFNEHSAHMPRCLELYTPPLLVIPQSPGGGAYSPKSYLLYDPICFNQSFYGFSTAGYKHADSVAAFLHLITHSELFQYHVLMTSSRMGAERRTFLKENIENFPFPEIESLSTQQRQKTVNLSSQLRNDNNKPWQDINNFIFEIYGLDKFDKQVIKDTLAIATPYKKSRQKANAAPGKIERSAFYKTLSQFLEPSFSVTNEQVFIQEAAITKQAPHPPWYFFSISTNAAPKKSSQAITAEHINKLVEEANRTGCSWVIIHEEGMLLVGIIGQYRYWTLTRARLCALDILRHHLDVFPVGRV